METASCSCGLNICPVARNVSAFGRPILAGEIGLVVWHGTHDFGADRDRMVTESFESMPDDETDRYEATRARFADSHRLLVNPKNPKH